MIRCASLLRRCALPLLALLAPLGYAGGPKYIAGSTYFNPASMGSPLHWSGGKVNYYVDQGALSSTVSNSAATAMVDAAAALWSNVSTAAVLLTDKGQLNEDVSGSNIQVSSSSAISYPSDVTASATAYPLAILYDSDGAIIDALYGADTSQPDDCSKNGVYTLIDNINTDATIAHATMILNGRCTSTSALRSMMSFNILRAFGRLLGLDYSQINPTALTTVVTGGTQGWPIMQPLDGVCSSLGGTCIAIPDALHSDDIAALSRLYPVTSSNISGFTGKSLTAANTVSITGTVNFHSGYGMQGVNVVARPLDSSGNPLYQYTVSAVTGALFRGTHGNPMTGTSDSSGIPYSRWGSTDSDLQGAYDLSAIPLPPGYTSAAFQISFETLDARYISNASVGAYSLGQVAPSGTLATFTTPVLSAGDSKTYTIVASDSAQSGYNDSIGSEETPRALSSSGFWVGRLSQIGQTDWFRFSVRSGRTFSVVTLALDESSAASSDKAMPIIGLWQATDAAGSSPVSYAPALNGSATGSTWLRATTTADTQVRIGVADQRGDGRPDYVYSGWVLYVDSVSPSHLPASGGAFVLHGMGFRNSDTVLVGGQAATITSISPNEITAIAPASSTSGSVDVEVDDLPALNAAAIVSGGLSYDSGSGDALNLVTAPSNTVALSTPLPFTVRVLDTDLKPVGNIVVTYTLTSGSATLGCGSSTCTVTSSGDGLATLNLTATSTSAAVVTASLANGSYLQAHFTGGTAASITALTTQQSVAAGATITWPVQALVLNGTSPSANQTVVWQTTVSGIVPQGTSSATTSSAGIASKNLTVGPLTEGQLVTISACVNGTSNCATFSALGARPEYALLKAVSGTSQDISTSNTPSALVFRLLDMNGNQLAGGTVTLYQALYSWTGTCSTHTVCTTGTLLATQSSAATSALDGLVSFSPLSLSGTATSLKALAVSGYTANVSATVSRH